MIAFLRLTDCSFKCSPIAAKPRELAVRESLSWLTTRYREDLGGDSGPATTAFHYQRPAPMGDLRFDGAGNIQTRGRVSAGLHTVEYGQRTHFGRGLRFHYG
jgi:hypothetical protein